MSEQNIATVDLRKIRQNALTVARQAETELLAVVKANAYGHGAEQVANALHGIAKGFCVALTEEGISLRYAGVTLPVLVLSPVLNKREAELCIRHELTVTAEGLSPLQMLLSAARRMKKHALVQLKVDTGMHRLGAAPGELAALFAYADRHPYCRVTGIYTHFANPKSPEFTARQYGEFLRAASPIKSAHPHLLLHAAATGGVAYGRRFGLDAVRVGLGLYGYGLPDVSPALSVRAPVIKRGYGRVGEPLGYGEPLQTPCSFALTRFGYADGALRKGGVYTPHCMDFSYLPETEGDFREILGKTRTAEKIAGEEGTVPYEILCRYTARARFSYLN